MDIKARFSNADSRGLAWIVSFFKTLDGWLEASFPTTTDDKFVLGNILATIGDEEEIGFFFSIKFNTFSSWDFVKVHSGTFEVTFVCGCWWRLWFVASIFGKILCRGCCCDAIEVFAKEVFDLCCEEIVITGLVELMVIVADTDGAALVFTIGETWIEVVGVESLRFGLAEAEIFNKLNQQ